MRNDEVLDRLQNLIKRKPSQKEIGSILNLAQTAISGRANRDSDFSDEEIELIEKTYPTQKKSHLVTLNNTIDIPYNV